MGINMYIRFIFRMLTGNVFKGGDGHRALLVILVGQGFST